MQTFLPYSNFRESMRCLDWKRLGKQRVEAMQIYNTLIHGSRWANHPAVLMWKGYENALLHYMNEAIMEWISRGFNNNMKLGFVITPVEYPSWIGDPIFHASHRSNLLRKDFDFYRQYLWTEPSNLPYIWPVQRRQKND